MAKNNKQRIVAVKVTPKAATTGQQATIKDPYNFKFTGTAIYKKYLDLTEQFKISTENIKREIKDGFRGDMLNDLLMQTARFSFIYDGMKEKSDKLTAIQNSLYWLSGFMIRLRVLVDTHFISQKHFIAIAIKIVELNNELTNFEKYLSKN